MHEEGKGHLLDGGLDAQLLDAVRELASFTVRARLSRTVVLAQPRVVRRRAGARLGRR
jgi:hypothetical protein